MYVYGFIILFIYTHIYIYVYKRRCVCDCKTPNLRSPHQWRFRLASKLWYPRALSGVSSDVTGIECAHSVSNTHSCAYAFAHACECVCVCERLRACFSVCVRMCVCVCWRMSTISRKYSVVSRGIFMAPRALENLECSSRFMFMFPIVDVGMNVCSAALRTWGFKLVILSSLPRPSYAESRISHQCSPALYGTLAWAGSNHLFVGGLCCFPCARQRATRSEFQEPLPSI